MDSMIHYFLDVLVNVGRAIQFPTLFLAFIGGVACRTLIYYTVKRHEWFAREFEIRVTKFLTGEMDRKTQNASFFVVTKRLLERTFYEVFEKRDRKMGTNPDRLMAPADRAFLVKMGCAWLVHDMLKQIRFLKYGMQPPKLISITKSTFSKNPAFNRIFGLVPSVAVNDFLNVLPGLFVIGGIFGTFLGVMKGLPELSGMDLNDPEKTKMIMDRFLVEVSISMGASITGIFLSVCMTVVNTLMSPERLFEDVVDRFENSLDLLWNYSHSNEVPIGLKAFDDAQDPVEALAAASLNQELERSRHRRPEEAETEAKTA